MEKLFNKPTVYRHKINDHLQSFQSFWKINHNCVKLKWNHVSLPALQIILITMVLYNTVTQIILWCSTCWQNYTMNLWEIQDISLSLHNVWWWWYLLLTLSHPTGDKIRTGHTVKNWLNFWCHCLCQSRLPWWSDNLLETLVDHRFDAMSRLTFFWLASLLQGFAPSIPVFFLIKNQHFL